MALKIDPRRVFLGYLFFSLGICLTLYQFGHLILYGGPMEPIMRQLLMIFVNTLAVYLGGLLVIPWHAQDWRSGDYEGRLHHHWMMAASLIFCFLTMVGLAIALILGPTTKVPETVTGGSDLFGDVTVSKPITVFPWSSYAIAALYMVGYGILGLGPKIARWVLQRTFGRQRLWEATNDGPEDDTAPPPPPKPKQKVYPIETRFVVGRVRPKRTPPEDTAQD